MKGHEVPSKLTYRFNFIIQQLADREDAEAMLLLRIPRSTLKYYFHDFWGHSPTLVKLI